MRTLRPFAAFALAAGLVVLLGDPSAGQVTAADDPPTKAEKIAQLKAKLKNADPETKARLKAKLKALLKEKKEKKAEPAPPPPPPPPPAEKPAPPKAAPAPREKGQPLVPPAPRDPAPLARLIDDHIDKKLTEAKANPAALCTDAEFLRRAALDLTGVIPTADQAKAFLDSTDPDKRAKLVDDLLADPNYGRRQSDVWQAKLLPRTSDNRFVLRQPFVEWLAVEFNANTAWDAFVDKLLTAKGTVEDNPAVTFYLGNRSVDKLTDATTRHFLGVQLQCAQCHNHPFTEWKQDEYWGMAEFFSKVRPDAPRNPLKGKDNTQIGVQETAARSRTRDFFPDSAKAVPPKFLGGDAPKLNRVEPYRPALAEWLTAADNPYFAKAAVNRVWGQMFGRGFVNPVDDLHDGNAPSHPELLDALAKAFAADGFDLKQLYRTVCRTKAYQRTSKPGPGTPPDDALFARMTVKVMAPEQLFDSLTRVTGADRAMAAKAKGMNRPLFGSPRDQFTQFFLAGADAAEPTEYEAGIPQALKLMNSRITAGGPQAARAFVTPGDRPAEVFERMYLAALSRRPTPAEVQRLTAYVNRAATPAAGYSDVLWAVLNSSEFTMVR